VQCSTSWQMTLTPFMQLPPPKIHMNLQSTRPRPILAARSSLNLIFYHLDHLQPTAEGADLLPSCSSYLWMDIALGKPLALPVMGAASMENRNYPTSPQNQRPSAAIGIPSNLSAADPITPGRTGGGQRLHLPCSPATANILVNSRPICF